MRPTPIYYYSSSSGLVRTFAVRLGRPAFNLADREHRTAIVTQPWVLLTPSYKSGNAHNDTIPEAVTRFGHNLDVVNNTIACFALLGLVLAALGLYGVVSNLVAQRTGEFGIRLALGAKPTSVLGLVLKTGLLLSGCGLFIGGVLAFLLNRALQASMPRMAGSDPVAILSVAVALFGISMLACYLPARRATKIDPIIALRGD